jgi:hypothetical protein
MIPVELTRFEAARDGDGAVTLTWATASETTNAGFEVQHAPGDAARNAPFASVAFVEGAGTTDVTQTYRHRLTGLAPGPHRFRLRQIDFDGDAALSPVVEVSVPLDRPLRVTVAPQPLRDAGWLRLEARAGGPVEAVLYDVLGRRRRTLYRGPLQAEAVRAVPLDVQGLASGVYLVRVTHPTGAVTRRVTVVR